MRTTVKVLPSCCALVFCLISITPIIEIVGAFTPINKVVAADNNKKAVDPQSAVQVYDNTFSPVVCQVLHALAVEHSFQVDGETSFFLRPPYNSGPLNPLEHAIDSALTALDNTDKLVEYWSRDEYMNIPAHVDIDETRLLQEQYLAVPCRSHVLYLDVNVKGPTCVFPSKLIEWSEVPSSSSQIITSGGDKEYDEEKVDLAIVPAVPGRLLGFPGSAMHAVPCPPDRWLVTLEEEMKLRAREEQEEVLGDDDGIWDEHVDEEEEEEIDRSVLLFNTWPEDGPQPLNSIESGIDSTTTTAQIAEWEDDYGVNGSLIRCNPHSTWSAECISPSGWPSALLSEDEKEGSQRQRQQEQGQIRVNLMGHQERRLYPDQDVLLNGPVQDIRNALGQEHKVSLFSLVQLPRKTSIVDGDKTT